MKTFFMAACFFLLSIPVWAGGSSEFVLPKGFSLALPKDGSVVAEWVAPPMSETQIRKAHFSFQKFRMDPRGSLWMCSSLKAVSNLSSGMVMTVARPVNDFIFLEDGAQFIVSDTALGFIPPLDLAKIQKGRPVLSFQPLLPLPAEKCSITADGNGSMFVYGYEASTQTYAVFELLEGFKGWRKIFVAAEKINAVAVNAGVLHIAAGRLVFRMRLGEKEAKVVFSHPLESVTGLADVPDVGLFYATHEGVGVVNGAAVEFMKCTSAQIIVRDRALYVVLPDTLGVLRLDHIERLISARVKHKE